MFYKKETNALSTKVEFQGKWIPFPTYYNLTNKRVLYVFNDYEQKKLILKLFLASNLETAICEKDFDDCFYHFTLLGIFQEGSILVRLNQQLVKISSEDLSIISSQEWHFRGNLIGFIDNHNFFCIDSVARSHPYFLYIYRWHEDKFIPIHHEELKTQPKKNAGFFDMGEIIKVTSLGQNRYCCHIHNSNPFEFKLVILEINQKINEVKELNQIQPEAPNTEGEPYYLGGKYLVFPNGYLLTYYPHHDGLQIWDPVAGTCMKQWNWGDLELPECFNGRNANIEVFPDSIHLLIYVNNTLFLFNTDNLAMKIIKGTGEVAKFLKLHILTGGYGMVALRQGNELKILSFDLPEIKYERDTLIDSQRFFRLAAHRANIPRELVDLIILRTITPDAKNLLATKSSDTAEIEKEQSALTGIYKY
ncbi:hypothetical protein [Legionella parisiensis]|uniref:Uncharacterized protein n=1 Tax=Legionella parisiensis TaxID=45071 RepID=A0A1E5JU70_9GAMM|nr:hypothetical protein [Legionella parisiensis]KTD40544.1 hypothetical protein Lpar_1861 [Legionella parisiensis]OEH48020.1 hypothetical protein lpari_00957 [Legionella parisiensis]STX72263.1 Uncharacterised protein [Legionella parisiensis]